MQLALGALDARRALNAEGWGEIRRKRWSCAPRTAAPNQDKTVYADMCRGFVGVVERIMAVEMVRNLPIRGVIVMSVIKIRDLSRLRHVAFRFDLGGRDRIMRRAKGDGKQKHRQRNQGA